MDVCGLPQFSSSVVFLCLSFSRIWPDINVSNPGLAFSDGIYVVRKGILMQVKRGHTYAYICRIMCLTLTYIRHTN